MKISKAKYEIKKQLQAGAKNIIKKDTIFFLDYGKLNSIRIFTNRHGEKIIALGYELAETGNMYFQHLFDRYPEEYAILKNHLKSN